MPVGFCEVCGSYIPEGDSYWRLEFHHGDGSELGADDVALISSMDCLLRFLTKLADHYAQHLGNRARADGEGGQR